MKPLMPGALKRAEFVASHYLVVIPAGLPMSFVTSTAAWVHIASKLRHLDMVTVIADDGSFEVDMRAGFRDIRNADGSLLRRELSWRVLREWRAGGEDAALGDLPARDNDGGGARFKVGWGGPAQKHRIVETATGKVVASNFSTKEEAEAALANLLATAEAA